MTYVRTLESIPGLIATGVESVDGCVRTFQGGPLSSTTFALLPRFPVDEKAGALPVAETLLLVLVGAVGAVVAEGFLAIHLRRTVLGQGGPKIIISNK